jgi:CheY-like chemotaxis protein
MMLNMSSSHPYYEKLLNIEECVRHGADLTRQLLGFARGGRYEVKPTNINDLIRKSSQMFGRTKREIRIHHKLQTEVWTVEVDRGQIEQVLLNLYVNAWQAMPDGGDLYLETANVALGEDQVHIYNLPPGRYVKILVADTGMGIEESLQQRVFEPFFTTKERGRGTGLGLASAYGVVKNHGGIISVSSRKKEGTLFTIFLPASRTPSKIASKTASQSEVVELQAEEDELRRGTETVLLVDDEDMILNVGRELLESLGYRVLTACCGEEALQLYAGSMPPVDLVLLDMIMPGLSGGETFQRLKAADPDVRVMLSSGYSLNEHTQDLLDRGCRGFIQKPFDAMELSQKLREMLQ